MGPEGEGETERLQQHRLAQTMRHEALGALARKISHDFNNILQVLAGRIELVEQLPDLPAEARHDLRSAQVGLDQAYRLLRQLKAYVLTDEVSSEQVALDTLAQSVVALFQPLLPTMVLRVTIDEPAIVVPGNASLLESALVELLINAAEAYGTQPGLITVSVGRGQRELPLGGQVLVKPYALLRVIDQGAGLDISDMTRLVDPFYSTRGERRGTGLGVVQQVARVHNGLLEANSTPGEGATFTLWLPTSPT